MAHTTVRPRRIKLRSETLRVDVLATVAHRAECSCGWQGPAQNLRLDAQRDAREHVTAEHR